MTDAWPPTLCPPSSGATRCCVCLQIKKKNMFVTIPAGKKEGDKIKREAAMMRWALDPP